jgi:hypothetical protein
LSEWWRTSTLQQATKQCGYSFQLIAVLHGAMTPCSKMHNGSVNMWCMACELRRQGSLLTGVGAFVGARATAAEYSEQCLYQILDITNSIGSGGTEGGLVSTAALIIDATT